MPVRYRLAADRWTKHNLDRRISGYSKVRVLDFERPENNEFLAVNQFTVVEERHERRPDIVVFVNGLPLAVIELKNAADEDADIWRAIYKPEIKLFTEVHAAITCPAIWPIVRDVAGRLLNRGLLAGDELAPYCNAARLAARQRRLLTDF